MTTITSTDPTTIAAHIWPNIIDGRETGGAGEEVLRDSPGDEVPLIARSASDFLVEVLASYDMARRGPGS